MKRLSKTLILVDQVCCAVLLRIIRAFQFFVIQKIMKKVLNEIKENGETTLETREHLAAKYSVIQLDMMR